MKKFYVRPESTVEEISLTDLLAESPNVGIDPTKSVDAGYIESRSSRNLWDDEE